MSDTPNLILPLLAASQAQKHITHNEALTLLDGLVMASVKSRVLATPPATPAEGDRYLVAASPTGLWAGQAGKLALYGNGAWLFSTAREGWRLWIDNEDIAIVFNGTSWAQDVPQSLQNLSVVGVNATADTTNKLSVSSSASLFNHIGNGHQIKINKNAVADTASILYQTGFSGRAEFGTTGDDDFHIKVSSNGSSFNEAIVVTAASGLTTVKKTLRIEPQASDPVTPVDGLLWYNSTTGKFRGRQAGTSVDLIGAGGGGGVSNAYANVTDGTVTAVSVASDTFKLRASTGLSVAVANNDATHGDNAIYSLNVPGLGALAAPAANDDLLTYDTSAAAHVRMSLSDTLKVVNLLTDDPAPDVAADRLLTYDASAAAAKSILPRNLFFERAVAMPRNGFEFFTDFIQETGATAGDNGMVEYIAGTGAAVTAIAATAANTIGIAQASTGTTATGRAGLGSSLSALRLGGGDWLFESYVAVPTLSNATERFQVAVGFFDTQTAINQVDGVYFLYDEGAVSTGSAASANWQLVTTSNSVRSFVTSTTAVGTGFVRLTIVINAAGTSANFLINGISAGTIATNIPIGAGRELGFGTLLIKSIGTTARTLNHDYINVVTRHTTSR